MNEHDLVDTGEMYLKAVLELEEEGVPAMRARLTERFDQSGPTVSQTVERLRRDGLLDLGSGRRIVLTEAGRSQGTAVMRKHRLAEVFLERVVGLDWEMLHVEACRWEHVISDRTAQLIDDLLERPRVSPYGNPIGGNRIGTEPQVERLDRCMVEPDGTTSRRIAWIGEPLQADPDRLRELAERGLKPGVSLMVTGQPPGGVDLIGDRIGTVRLPAALARHVFVVALGAASPDPEVGAVHSSPALG